jgi:hypothetical protein
MTKWLKVLVITVILCAAFAGGMLVNANAGDNHPVDCYQDPVTGEWFDGASHNDC